MHDGIKASSENSGTHFGGFSSLSLCFCPACMKAARAAGVNAQAARKLVINELNRSFEKATSASDIDSFARSEAEFLRQGPNAFDALPDLRAYLEWRRSPVLSLLEEVRDAVLPDTKVLFLSLSSPDAGWLFGVDIEEIGKRCEGMIVCCYDSTADMVRTNISETAAILSKSGKSAKTTQSENTELHAGFRLFYPEISSAPELKSRVSAALKGGADGLVFYNYGLIPKPRLGWIKESLN